ncbi:hypothetical protein CR513_59543, partial [Mucuna pruriens]
VMCVPGIHECFRGLAKISYERSHLTLIISDFINELDINEKKQQTSIMANTYSNFVQLAISKLNDHYDH